MIEEDNLRYTDRYRGRQGKQREKRDTERHGGGKIARDTQREAKRERERT